MSDGEEDDSANFCAPNSHSKFNESRKAFVGATPFSKRLQRALKQEDEPSNSEITMSRSQQPTAAGGTLKYVWYALFITVFLAVFVQENVVSEKNVADAVKSKRVVVAGASSGIGSELARALAKRQPALLVLSARREDRLRNLANECLALGAREVIVVATDLSEISGVEHLIRSATSTTGANDDGGIVSQGRTIDFLFLNHALLRTMDWVELATAREQATFVELDTMIRTSFLSHANIATAALGAHHMSRDGRIIVTSSAAGTAPVHMQASYSAAKHALNGFFGSLRQDLAYHESNTTISIALVGRISTENSDKDLKGQYRFLPSSDATEAAEALLRGAVLRSRTIRFPRAQLRMHAAFSSMLPAVYDALVVLSAHSHPCTNVSHDAFLIPSCLGEISRYIRN